MLAQASTRDILEKSHRVGWAHGSKNCARAGLEAGRRQHCAPANGGGVRLDIKIDAARHGCPTADTAVDRRQWMYSKTQIGSWKESLVGCGVQFTTWRLCRRAYNWGAL